MSSDNSSEFKILVASDIHLGYNERHPIRGNDSFEAFEEILKAANTNDVDFILLAGDLFHINKPSLLTIRKTFALIRKYCFGEPKNSFNIKNFKAANVFDQNLKVRYPIFTIHGNHDDPIGVHQISSVDVLNSSGFVNYFGKRSNVEEVLLKPIFMNKGDTNLALYGLGSMHEERLHHLIESNKFNYLTPKGDLMKYFKILLVHQNRIPRPGTKYLNPKDLGDLPDLVIWGHEHNCVDETKEESLKFFILQPGSTVATSLCEAEAGEKYYFILNVVHKPNKAKPVFRCDKYKCKTVRPFLFHSINVDEILLKVKVAEQQTYLINYCVNEVKNLINDSHSYCSEKLPLIRLRIDYSDKEHLFEVNQIDNKFNNKVGNPGEIVRFVKRSSKNQMPLSIDDGEDFNMAGMFSFLDDDVLKKEIQVKALMEDYFSKKKLALLNENNFTNKVIEFVQKGSVEILNDFFSDSKKLLKKSLLKLSEDNLLDLNDIKTVICDLKNKKQVTNKKKSSPFDDSDFNDDDVDNKSPRKTIFNDDDSDVNGKSSKPKLSRGRGRTKATTTRKKEIFGEDSDTVLIKSDDDSDEDVKPVLKQTRGKGRGVSKSTKNSRDICINISDSDDNKPTRKQIPIELDDDSEEIPKPKRSTRGRGRGGSKRTIKTTANKKRYTEISSEDDDEEDNFDDDNEDFDNKISFKKSRFN